METITFNNKTFPIRTIDIPEYGNDLTVATIELNEQIMDKEGNYVSDEAEALDQKIFFFVDEQEIEMDEYELVAAILYSIE